MKWHQPWLQVGRSESEVITRFQGNTDGGSIEENFMAPKEEDALCLPSNTGKMDQCVHLWRSSDVMSHVIPHSPGASTLYKPESHLQSDGQSSERALGEGGSDAMDLNYVNMLCGLDLW